VSSRPVSEKIMIEIRRLITSRETVFSELGIGRPDHRENSRRLPPSKHRALPAPNHAILAAVVAILGLSHALVRPALRFGADG
jgi:hypothetical protein